MAKKLAVQWEENEAGFLVPALVTVPANWETTSEAMQTRQDTRETAQQWEKGDLC